MGLKEMGQASNKLGRNIYMEPLLCASGWFLYYSSQTEEDI
jgi:hypothetical protein